MFLTKKIENILLGKVDNGGGAKISIKDIMKSFVKVVFTKERRHLIKLNHYQMFQILINLRMLVLAVVKDLKLNLY